MAKSKKVEELEQQLAELTADLQRTRADFENYRKRVDEEKIRARQLGETTTVVKLLPIIDVLERAVTHVPKELHDNSWAAGVVGVSKKLKKLLTELDLERMCIKPGETEFDPELHEAVSTEDGEGEREVISEELQAGYLQGGTVIRHAMVRVSKI